MSSDNETYEQMIRRHRQWFYDWFFMFLYFGCISGCMVAFHWWFMVLSGTSWAFAAYAFYRSRTLK